MINKFLHPIFKNIERGAAFLQGKGYGASTIVSEVDHISRMLPREPALIIDIGGNRGEYTAEIRRRYQKVRICVFEPSPKNIGYLEERFAGDSKITIIPCAVAGSSGQLDLFFDEPGSGLASLSKRRLDHFGINFNSSHSVKTIRFEDYWKEELNSRHIDFVKLDIEGHELSALTGFGLAIKSTGLIQFEFGGANIDSRTYFQDLFYFFTNSGFDLYRITPFGACTVNKYSEWDEVFVTTNFIAKNRAAS